MSNKDVKKLELKIRGGMLAIKQGTKTPKEASLGVAFKILKEKDEALYETLIEEYKEILKK